MSASCCGFDRRNVTLIGLTLLLAIAITGWVREATKPSPRPPEETVEVLVAAHELKFGTLFTKSNVGRLTTKAVVARSELPTNYLVNKEELIGKLLARPIQQGGFFNADAGAKTFIPIPDGTTIVSIPSTQARTASPFVGPGVRGDLLASIVEESSREVFTLLPDMYVLAINAEPEPTKDQVFPTPSELCFAVTQKQSFIIALAMQRECNVELWVKHPDAPKRDFDIDKTLVMLLEWRKNAVAPPPRVISER